MDYDIDDLDKDGVLKPGFVLTFCMVILCRQLFFGPLMFLTRRSAKRGGVSKQDLDLSFIEVTTFWEFAACLPALVILVSLFLRKPAAGNIIRTIWSNGKLLLLTGLLAQVLVLLFPLVSAGDQFRDFNVYILLIHGFLLVYLLKTQRPNDVFRVFPEWEENSEGR